MNGHDRSSKSVPIAVDTAFVCHGCDRRWYYTRSCCPDCGTSDHSTYELTDGELVAWTEIAVTPPDVRTPNRVGLARFGEIRLIAQVSDEAISVGDRVTFAGAYRLRDGGGPVEPRLTSLE